MEQQVDKWFTENYTDIQRWVRSATWTTGIEQNEVISELYLYLKKQEGKYFPAANCYFFLRTFKSKMGHLQLKSKETPDIAEEIQEQSQAEIYEQLHQLLEENIKALTAPYAQLYDLVFVQKKCKIREIQESIGCTESQARTLRNNLITKLGGDPKNFKFKLIQQ